MLRRVVTVAAAAVVIGLVAVGISGQFVFADARGDLLRHADAVVVLGGEHDGREQYGIDLAQELGAPAVLLSDPYPATDPVMTKLCGRRVQGVEVICRPPSPSTTRGEALMSRELAQTHGWKTIVVASWRFHLPRARVIFDECYSGDGRQAIMHPVPDDQNISMAVWEYVYLYQYAALLKNLFEGPCDAVT